MVMLWGFGWREHQPRASTIKKCQWRSAEQVRQTQRIAVETGGSSGVVNPNGNLSDAFNHAYILRDDGGAHFFKITQFALGAGSNTKHTMETAA